VTVLTASSFNMCTSYNYLN